MKKSLFFLLCITLITFSRMKSQCVFSCYNYTLAPITYSAFPNGGTNVIPQFLPTIDDGITSPLPIGFNFNYYCGTYSTVLICSNGFIQFDIGSPPSLAFSNPAQTFPDPTSPNGIVALNMNDFDPNMGGSITYTTIGTTPNRQFIVTYSNVPIWSYNTSLNDGQIVLYETTNVIEIHSNSINASNTNIYNGTQGIENPAGTQGIGVPGRNNTLFQVTSPSAYRFVPIATYSPVPPTSVSGPTQVCQGSTNNYTVSSSPNATGYAWYLPPGWGGTSTLSVMPALGGTSGNVSVAATYSCGTSAPIGLSVTVIPSPVVALSVTPAILCSGITVTFNATGAITYTLDPVGIVGGPPFTTMPFTSTSYTLRGVDATGCESQNNATAFVTVKETPTVSVNSGTVCVGQGFTITPVGAPSYIFSSTFANVTPTLGVNNYSVVGTGTNGCVSNTAISTVTAMALPVIAAIPTRSAICIKESTTIKVSGASTYTWSTNATGTVITVNPIANSAYNVTGTDARGCVNSGTATVIVNACTGIATNTNETSLIQLFPNPTKGVFKVHTIVTGDNNSIEVYNAVGALIWVQKINNEDTEINLSEYANGLYYVKLKTASQESTLKLIKN